MKVIDFGDKFTEKKFQIENESTFAMIKPNAFQNAGNIKFKLQTTLKYSKKISFNP